jgi:hypothetical protein
VQAQFAMFTERPFVELRFRTCVGRVQLWNDQAMTEPQRVPAAIVYQNSDFVGSLTQAVTGGGLAQSGETEFSDGTGRSDDSEKGFDAHAGGEFQAPAVAKLAGDFGGKRARTLGTSEEHRRRHRLGDC